MKIHRCAAHGADCGQCGGLNRRQFVTASASLVSASMLSPSAGLAQEKIAPAGPAASFVPTVKAAFVRRKGPYGMQWPGQIYDGEAARAKYLQQLTQTAKEYKIKLDLLSEPLHSLAESQAWLDEAKAAQADGLLLVLLDRQQHTWPSA